MTSRDMRRLDLDELQQVSADHEYPLVFATVSGAHLYGFASRDSDVDLRGVHVLGIDDLIGLSTGPQTVDRTWVRDGAEIDLVTHDIGKFVRMMLRRNGYVLEQLLSPLVVTTTGTHAELVAAAPGCLTRHHVHHYRGFARGQWDLFNSSGALKPLLYAFRVLLTGVHLMRSAEVVADLPTLTELVPGAPAYLRDLMAAKALGEHGSLATSGVDLPVTLLQSDLTALTAELEDAALACDLPQAPTARPQLHDLLIRVRTAA